MLGMSETKTSFPNFKTLAAEWNLFCKILIAFGCQISALEKAGVRGAFHKAELLDAMAQAALFELVRHYSEACAAPDSPEREALLRALETSAYVLIGLRVVAWNVMLGPAARAERLGAMAVDFTQTGAVFCQRPADPVAAIDSS